MALQPRVGLLSKRWNRPITVVLIKSRQREGSRGILEVRLSEPNLSMAPPLQHSAVNSRLFRGWPLNGGAGTTRFSVDGWGAWPE